MITPGHTPIPCFQFTESFTGHSRRKEGATICYSQSRFSECDPQSSTELTSFLWMFRGYATVRHCSGAYSSVAEIGWSAMFLGKNESNATDQLAFATFSAAFTSANVAADSAAKFLKCPDPFARCPLGTHAQANS
jgi:hypothetical protein